MSQNHEGHNHGPSSFENINKAFYLGILLNLVFTIVEFVVGYLHNSLSLISDATHNLSDVASLIISLIGMKLAQKAATLTYTYGYKKASILASFINSVLLLVVVFNILKEAYERFDNPPEVGGKVIIITALFGVVINTLSAFLFYKGQKDDINIRGAFLHLLVDAVVSVGVVISGIFIYYTKWNMIDIIISVIIAIVILITTWSLFKESLKLTLDGIPKGIDLAKIKMLINNSQGIKSVHHVHIWAISSTTNALSAHIVLDNISTLDELMDIKTKLKHELQHQNIQHITLELDTNLTECKDLECH
jgi:cobalt-zinc-cadmium efflux system protein